MNDSDNKDLHNWLDKDIEKAISRTHRSHNKHDAAQKNKTVDITPPPKAISLTNRFYLPLQIIFFTSLLIFSIGAYYKISLTSIVIFIVLVPALYFLIRYATKHPDTPPFLDDIVLKRVARNREERIARHQEEVTEPKVTNKLTYSDSLLLTVLVSPVVILVAMVPIVIIIEDSSQVHISNNIPSEDISISERANTYQDQRERRIDIAVSQTDESDIYGRDIKVIRLAVLSDTINPSSAQFCSRFEVLKNKRGNRVYVGWYTSTDVFGVRGKDNIIAEIDSSGNLVQLSIGDI